MSRFVLITFLTCSGIARVSGIQSSNVKDLKRPSSDMTAELDANGDVTTRADVQRHVQTEMDSMQANYKLLKANVECGSKDKSMGAKSNVQECANAVSAAGGTFFIFGKGTKAARCFHEFTKTASCSDPGSGGWQNDDYDFFTIHDATSLCKAPNVQGAVKHDGYEDSFRGWYDVQGCGKCNDYCRWVGDTNIPTRRQVSQDDSSTWSGHDPSLYGGKSSYDSVEYGKSWWSCAMGGESNPYTTMRFPLWNLKRCHGMSMPTPRATYMIGRSCVAGCQRKPEYATSVRERQCSAMATSLVTVSQCRAAAAAVGLPFNEIVSASDSRNKFHEIPEGCFKEGISGSGTSGDPKVFGVSFNEGKSHRQNDPNYELLCRDV